MKKNKDRKKDLSIIQDVLNDNEYHPVTVAVKFNKNSFYYEVHCNPSNPKEDQHYCFYISQKQTVELMKNGLQIIKFRVSWPHPGIWSTSADYKLSELVFSLHLRIAREDEKYLWRSYEY